MKKVLCLLMTLCIVAALLCACGEPEEKKVYSTIGPTEAPADVIEHPVDASWFDDAVFVGDSITLKLSYYCEDNEEALGKAQFFCAGSLGYNSAMWDLYDEEAVHPYYQGESVQAEYCAEKTGAKKVFLMLGMNDIAVYGTEGSGEGCANLVDAILSHTPDVTIYIQSTTPILSGCEIGDLNNQNVDAFNVWLKNYCDEKGYKFLDVNSILRDENGYLKEEYCSDPDDQGIHFTDEACNLWADYLKNNV